MLTFDLRDFERAASRFDKAADQIPFALAQSLNDGAEATRTVLTEVTWPRAIQMRNPRFLNAALTTRGSRATKRNLTVAIVDKLGRASLLAHSRGGMKRPKGANLAVPSGVVKGRRSARGVPKGLRPSALPNSFRKGDEIYQRVGTGKSRSLKLMYTLQPSARIRPDVPFESAFERTMTREVWRAFGPRLQAAMAGRRR